VRDLALWIMVFTLVVLPLVLVMIWKRTARSRVSSADNNESKTDGLRYARGFGGAASALPVLLLLLGFLPEQTSQSLPAALFVLIVIAGALAGLCGLCLYLFHGRGAERWTGSLASVMAIGLLILFALASGAAA
jgi:uncharacterized membrane protein YecN with MAPEG domain